MPDVLCPACQQYKIHVGAAGAGLCECGTPWFLPGGELRMAEPPKVIVALVGVPVPASPRLKRSIAGTFFAAGAVGVGAIDVAKLVLPFGPGVVLLVLGSLVYVPLGLLAINFGPWAWSRIRGLRRWVKWGPRQAPG